MGYTTTFKGKFRLDRPAGDDLILAMTAMDERPGGPDGYCQWILSRDNTAIVWDGGEKFYGFILWIRLIATMLGEMGYKINGSVKWHGEESGDSGTITAAGNAISWVGSNRNRGGERRDESPKAEAKMTFADLLAALQKLTPDQLKHPAIWMGEERGGVVKEFFVQTEDQVCPDDESWEPRAAFLESNHEDYDLTREEAEKFEVVSAKGQPYLMVD